MPCCIWPASPTTPVSSWTRSSRRLSIIDCFEPMVVAAKKAGVKRFVYCSSSSVYGVSDSPNVTEEHPLVPLDALQQVQGHVRAAVVETQIRRFHCVVMRPATVCGYSPRTRLDLSVNILTNHAVNKGAITVFGGNQMRPNLHIEDMVDAYLMMLEAPHEKVQGETFNIGFQNHSIAEIAGMVKQRHRGGDAGKRRDQNRHDAVQRHALLSRQFGQGARASSASSRSAPSRTRCAISRALSAITCCPTVSMTIGTITSAR